MISGIQWVATLEKVPIRRVPVAIPFILSMVCCKLFCSFTRLCTAPKRRFPSSVRLTPPLPLIKRGKPVSFSRDAMAWLIPAWV